MIQSRLIKNRKPICFIALFFVLSLNVFAVSVPQMNGPVNDLAHILKATEKAELSRFLEATSEQTTVQVALLTMPTIEDRALEEFSWEVAETWGLGQKDIDNGVLLLVVMDTRKIRIEVGYGLEGSLTDVKAGLIIRNIIAPAFQREQYGTGIIEASKTIVGIATDNTEIVSKKMEETDDSNGANIIPFIFFVIYFLLMSGAIGKRRGLRWYPFYWLLKNANSSGRSFSSGSSFSSGGSFRSGGGFGGGFSGGGGSFGGGGASGGW